MSERTSRRFKKLTPLWILLGGVILMIALIAIRRKPEKVETSFAGALVEVISVATEARQATIRGTGSVRARQEISLAPQIGGRVEWVSPQFIVGGQFKRGEAMLRIESVDYKLAVEQAKAAVAQAEYLLSLEQARADVAQREWTMIRNQAEDTTAPSGLVKREPQLRQAEASLASAQAALELANLNLSRTTITAPFDCRIRRENADIGQYVNPGMVIAQLFSTDVVEVEVGLSPGELSWIDIPESKANVRLATQNGIFTWSGHVNRSTGAIDSLSRLARVVVQIQNPEKTAETSAPELTIGAFVDVEIIGKSVSNVIPIPRSALRSGSVVWVCAPDSALEIREVTAVRTSENEALISSGLRDGELIVLTPLTGAASGLKLRPVLRERKS